MLVKNSVFTPVLLSILMMSGLWLWACETPDERTVVDAPPVLISRSIDHEGRAVFDQNRLYLEDYSNALHAIFTIAGNSRSSELGNENYRPELQGQMGERARDWLDLVGVTEDLFNVDGRFMHWYEQVDGGYAGSQSVDLGVYPHLVYAYHMHHRGSRFEEHDMMDALNREPHNYIVSPGRYLLDNHYQDGLFFHDDGKVDLKSMSHGLAGIHGHIYAWVVWAKPDGADNMGLIDEELLTAWMGYSKEDMADIAMEITQVLDMAWDEAASIYDFAQEDTWTTGLMPSSTVLSMATQTDGKTWTIDALGSMIRGHKALYEALHMFGEGDEPAAAAQRLFDRNLALFEQIQPLAKAWGLPHSITFGSNGARAASDKVDVYHSYQFLNHLGGGFGWDREREGTSGLMGEQRPDISAAIGELSDLLLLGAAEYQMQNGRLVSTLNYSDGRISDDRTTVSAAGMYITAAGNMYLKGEAFNRAADWPDASDEVAAQSRLLYDSMMSHYDLIQAIIQQQ